MTLRAFLTRLIWLCVLPLLLLTVWLAIDRVDDLMEQHDSEAERVALNAATAVDQELSARIGALQLLALSPLGEQPSHWPELYVEAQRFRQAFDSHVVLADAEGRTQFHTAVALGDTIAMRPMPAGRSALQVAMSTGRPAVGDLVRGPIAGEALVAIAAPAMREGKAAFTLLGLVKARQFSERLRSIRVPAGWTLKLLDSAGGIIASTGPATGSRDGRETAAPERFVAQASVAPWSTVLELPASHHRVPAIKAIMAMVFAVLGATLVGVLGGHWAASRLARSVQSLAAPAASGPAGPEIAEVTAVRRLLDTSRAALDRAETDRRDSEASFSASLEQASIAIDVREAQLRGIFETANEAIITTDKSQTIVMANPAAARMFGCTVDELIGAPLERLVPERYREQHRLSVQAFGDASVSARHMGLGPHLSALRANGEEFPIEAAISHVHVDGQRLYTVILRDITLRRRADDELRTSKAKLEAALASMSDAVFIADADGRFVEFNDAFASFHRFASKADCPRTLAEYAQRIELRWPDGRPTAPEQAAVARALRGEAASNVEYRLQRKDTRESWVGSHSFAPIRSPDGSIGGAVVTARDITELRRVQDELEISHADLRRLVAAQDSVQEAERKRIAAELHDDLQQTLAAVLMESTAARSAPAPLAVQTQEALARIDDLARAAIVSTRRIVNDLRPQMLEELGLHPALEALAVRFTEWTGVPCVVDAAGFDPAVDTPSAPVATCLFRVAQESLNNVAKHAQATRAKIRLRRSREGDLVLTISDDGKGVRLDDRRKLDSFGLLGMAERVRAIGGTLHVSGRHGAGTTVEVRVALTGPAEQA